MAAVTALLARGVAAQDRPEPRVALVIGNSSYAVGLLKNLSWECWLSYNAALTASDLGYTNLYWYRGGISAWNQARLPVVRTKLLKQF